MTEKCYIGLKTKEKTEFIYCYWEGNISDCGAILANHYKDIAKIEKLLKKGDILCVEKELDDIKPLAWGKKEATMINEHNIKYNATQKNIPFIYFYNQEEKEWYFSHLNQNGVYTYYNPLSNVIKIEEEEDEKCM